MYNTKLLFLLRKLIKEFKFETVTSDALEKELVEVMIYYINPSLLFNYLLLLIQGSF